MTEQAFILRLPYKVRFRIYVELDLILTYTLDLSYFQAYGEWYSRDHRIRTKDNMNIPWNLWDMPPPRSIMPRITNQIFYVSRAVSEDARTMFYSENKFSISHGRGCGLQRPMILGSLAWKSLRFICINLGTSCQFEAGCHGTVHSILEKDSQLNKNTGVLSDWLQISDLLATHIKHDDQLELRLICDAATTETAKAFLDPLQKLPRLKECSIRLGPYWNPDLQQMTMTTIRQKTRYPTQSAATFRFSDLPIELQIHILEYSDLVSPTPLSYQSHRNTFIHKRCRVLECNAHSYWDISDGNYCPSTHTAFSTAQSCWQTPDMLFLVSKTMRQLVIPIFYSKNILEVECSPLNPPQGAAWSLQKSAFLRFFPKYSFPYLRHIHWKFPDIDNRRAFHSSNKEMEDWVISLNLISLLFPPGKLTVELNLSYSRLGPWGREDLSEIAVDWAYYGRIVKPMACLNGILKDLFIHIGCPMHPSLEQMRVSKEQSLEQSVMGFDYNSFARGKKAYRTRNI